MCDQEEKNETVRMSRRNQRRDLTIDLSGHIVVQIPDIIYLFLEIMFVMFVILE